MPAFVVPAVELLIKYGPVAAKAFVELWHRKDASKDDWLDLLTKIEVMDYDKTIAAAQERLDKRTAPTA